MNLATEEREHMKTEETNLWVRYTLSPADMQEVAQLPREGRPMQGGQDMKKSIM